MHQIQLTDEVYEQVKGQSRRKDLHHERGKGESR
jgi:hypothetical protein